MSPGLISVISAKSEEFTCLFLTFMEKYLFRSGWSSGISSPSGKILIPVRMVLGNFQPERKEPYHAILVDLHEPSVFCGEYQRWRVAEIYKAEMAVGAYLAVQHRRDFARIVLRIPSQSVPRGHGVPQPEIDLLEELWRCFSVPIEFRKHECMKGVVAGRRNLRRDDPVPLGIHQQHSCCREEFLQIFGDSQLL